MNKTDEYHLEQQKRIVAEIALKKVADGATIEEIKSFLFTHCDTEYERVDILDRCRGAIYNRDSKQKKK